MVGEGPGQHRAENGSLNHKDYFIFRDFKWTEANFLTSFLLMWPLAKIITWGEGKETEVFEPLLYARLRAK